VLVTARCLSLSLSLWDLPTATPLHTIAAQIYEAGGVVAAVCHGPAVFGGLKLSNGQYLVAGKRVNAFTVEEEEKMGQLDFLRQQNVPLCSDLITKAGGTYEKGGVMKGHYTQPLSISCRLHCVGSGVGWVLE